MTLPPDPRDWPLDWREWWEEIAARIQFDGHGCSRAESEALAEREVRRTARDTSKGIVFPAHRD